MTNSAGQLNKVRTSGGFTLVEILTVLIISTMIVMAAIMIFGRVRADAAAINLRLDRQNLPQEILQKIAEDLDRLAVPGFNAKVSFRNKIDNGFNTAQMIIECRYDTNAAPSVPRRYEQAAASSRPQDNQGAAAASNSQIYERIVWQANYDLSIDSLVLYRSHSGLNYEDKVVDKARQEEVGEELFVPVYPGLTHFQIEAISGTEQPQPLWQSDALPRGIIIHLSTEPFQVQPDGSLALLQESIITRAVAIDRTRLVIYNFVAQKYDADPNAMPQDPNTSAPSQSNSKTDKEAQKKTDGASVKPNEKETPDNISPGRR